ncbi:MAG: peptidoglycan DD-metalloendopeptidase family protein [candidate division Zixibacteria bacterium]|nr:peptidoglycan DD-metalloendopeptidase family protein [candidate division Zixibacteria bacterium]
MNRNKITLLCIPDQNQNIKSITVSRFGIFFLLSMLGLLFLLSGWFGYEYFRERMKIAELERLQSKNEFLINRLHEMDLALEQVRLQVDRIVEKDKDIRMVFDIPAVDPQTRQLGTGGTFKEQMIPLNTKLATNLSELQNEIQTVLKTVQFENASYATVLDELNTKKYLLDHTPSIKPCEGYYASGFGYRPDPFTGKTHLHTGLDIAGEKGTPVYATADGKVINTGWAGRLGRIITIDHGCGYKTVYGHLEDINVRRGQAVKRWQTIGLMGSSGRSTGPHLHYEVHKNRKARNPWKYIFSEVPRLY